jgi:hypothetical protein
MLEKILKLYVMYMAADVRSPLPHLVGPPGCGKSTAVEQAAQLLGVNLHIINVSRLSPLEIEGVQMPHGTGEEMVLRMLPATFWTSLKDGDILLLDEFLRGFPEVYNGLLDILTSRRVGAFVLPKVFIIGASNSTVAYDPALEDRLIHLPVNDPRTNKKHKAVLAQLIVDGLGLNPIMVNHQEMHSLLDTVVLPMFDVLDAFKKKGTTPSPVKGKSIRNLIGQALLREVETTELAELISMNNRETINSAKWQYMFLLSGKNVDPRYTAVIPKIPRDKLTPLQLTNLQLNEQLLQMEAIRNEKEGTEEDDDDPFTDLG